MILYRYVIEIFKIFRIICRDFRLPQKFHNQTIPGYSVLLFFFGRWHLIDHNHNFLNEVIVGLTSVIKVLIVRKIDNN